MGRVRIATIVAANRLHRWSLDRSHLFWVVALPLSIVLVLGASLTPSTDGAFVPTRPYEVALAAPDDATRRALAAALGNAPEHVRVTTFDTADAARGAVLRRDLDVAVIVPAAFPTLPIRVVGAPGDVAVEVVSALLRDAVPADEALLGAVYGVTPAPVVVTPVPDQRPVEAPAGAGEPWREVDAYGYFSVAMAIFFALFTAHAGLTEHAKEGRGGIAMRTRAFGVDDATRTLAGVVGSATYVAVVLGVLALCTWGLFGFDWGDPMGWLLLTAVGSIALVAVYLLLLAAVPEPAAFESIGGIVTIAMAILGGSVTSLGTMSESLVARFTWLPNRALLDGYFALSAGGGWLELAGPIARLTLVAAVAFALAAFVSSRRPAREVR